MKKLIVILSFVLFALEGFSQGQPEYSWLINVWNKRTNQWDLVWRKDAVKNYVNQQIDNDSVMFYVKFDCVNGTDKWVANGDTLVIDTCFMPVGTVDQTLRYDTAGVDGWEPTNDLKVDENGNIYILPRVGNILYIGDDTSYVMETSDGTVEIYGEEYLNLKATTNITVEGNMNINAGAATPDHDFYVNGDSYQTGGVWGYDDYPGWLDANINLGSGTNGNYTYYFFDGTANRQLTLEDESTAGRINATHTVVNIDATYSVRVKVQSGDYMNSTVDGYVDLPAKSSGTFFNRGAGSSAGWWIVAYTAISYFP